MNDIIINYTKTERQRKLAYFAFDPQRLKITFRDIQNIIGHTDSLEIFRIFSERETQKETERQRQSHHDQEITSKKGSQCRRQRERGSESETEV